MNHRERTNKQINGRKRKIDIKKINMQFLISLCLSPSIFFSTTLDGSIRRIWNKFGQWSSSRKLSPRRYLKVGRNLRYRSSSWSKYEQTGSSGKIRTRSIHTLMNFSSSATPMSRKPAQSWFAIASNSDLYSPYVFQECSTSSISWSILSRSPNDGMSSSNRMHSSTIRDDSSFNSSNSELNTVVSWIM